MRQQDVGGDPLPSAKASVNKRWFWVKGEANEDNMASAMPPRLTGLGKSRNDIGKFGPCRTASRAVRGRRRQALFFYQLTDGIIAAGPEDLLFFYPQLINCLLGSCHESASTCDRRCIFHTPQRKAAAHLLLASVVRCSCRLPMLHFYLKIPARRASTTNAAAADSGTTSFPTHLRRAALLSLMSKSSPLTTLRKGGASAGATSGNSPRMSRHLGSLGPGANRPQWTRTPESRESTLCVQSTCVSHQH